MAKGKISEDTIKLIMEADSSKLQQEIHQTTKDIGQLEKERKALLEQEAAMKAAHVAEGKEYKELTRRIKENAQATANAKLKQQELYKALGTGSMTMAQLRKEAKTLQRQLDSTSQALHPKEYEAYASKLREVKARMDELKTSAAGLSRESGSGGGFGGMLKNIVGSELNFSSVKSLLMGSGILAAFGAVFEAAVAIGKQIFAKAKLFYEYSLEVEEAQRLTREFLNVTGEQLSHVQSQISAIARTMGRDYKTVLQGVDTLMHQFDISAQEALNHIKDGIEAGADANGNFMDQLNRYAPAFRDAGVSVEELVALITQTRSGIFNEQGMALIQTATNRLRIMTTQTQAALTAIGIDAKQLESDLVSGRTSIVEAIKQISERIGRLPQQSQQVGEVMKDVFGKTASNEGMKLVTELARVETSMDRLKEVTGEYGALQREQVEVQAELNEKLNKMFGIGEGGFESMTAKTRLFILKGLIKTIDYCQSLYDKLATVRAVVETVKVAFDTVFKVCEVGFRWLIDSVKATGRVLRSVGEMLEGILTFNPDKIASGFDNLLVSINKFGQELAADGKSVGERWGQNVVDSINKVMGKKKVRAPEVEESKDTAKKTETTATDALPKGKGTEDKKADQKKTDDLKRRRQQELQAEQETYEASLRAYKEQLARRELTQQQYDTVALALARQHTADVLGIEQQYLTESEAMQLKDANKKQNLIGEQQKNVATARKAALDAELAAYQDYQKNMQQLEQQGMNDRQLQEQAHEQQLRALEAYYRASLQYAQEHNEELLSIELAYQQAREKLERDYTLKTEQEKMQLRRQYGLATMQEQYQAELAQLKRHLDEMKLTQEEYDQAVGNLDRDYEEKRRQVRQQYGLVSQQEQYDLQLEQLRQYKEQEMLTEEEYEKAKAQLKMESWKEQFDYYSKLFGDAFSALQDAEMANVDAKYDAQIEAARKAGEDTTELEQKKADEQLRIQKKYADVNFAIKASQIIADTAVAIMKALSDLGPIAGPIAAALMGVTGAAQLSTANAERQKVKNMTLNGSGSSSTVTTGTRVATGLEQGGYVDVERRQDGRQFHARYDPDRRGYVSRPTVIVGEGPQGQSKEWVASNAAVENPTVRPLLDVLDRAQRAGQVRSLDMRKVMYQLAGHAQGGTIGRPAVTPSTISAPPTAPPADSTLTARLTALLERMERNGVKAVVGLDELDARRQLQLDTQSLGSK